MVELPCKDCDMGGKSVFSDSENWCALLGKDVKSVEDIPLFHDFIPGLKEPETCVGFMEKKNG